MLLAQAVIGMGSFKAPNGPEKGGLPLWRMRR